jgi:signal transduction histidine kinase
LSEERARPSTETTGACCCDAIPQADGESPESLKATIAALQDELIACQRLALLGSLAAMAAHEFNNLMTPIVARVEAALMGEDVPFMRKALERTLTQSQRAIGMTRHLLDLAHNEYHPTECCSVAAAVREAIDTAARPFQKDGIDLRVSVPEELHVCAREDLLCQVLLNLLLNARQAMKGIEGTLSVNAMADGDAVRIDVRDSGKGIPQQRLDDVVNPFLRSDPRSRPNDWQDVGLGLSVCRMITRLHNASMRAFANEDCGCTFRLHWPVSGNADPEDATR